MQMTPDQREGLHQSLREGITKGTALTATLSLAIKDRVWEGRVDRQGRTWKFDSFLEYLTANAPGGLFTKLVDIRPLIVHDVELLALFDKEVQRSAGGDRQSDEAKSILYNIQDAPTGTSRQAAVRRLRKDRPDLLEKVVAGELSANAAAIEAGFRKKLTGIDRLRSAWKTATALERREFLKEVG